MSQSGFYDTRDDLVGGSDTQWSPVWDGAQNADGCPTSDQRSDDNSRFSGVLSQADLAK